MPTWENPADAPSRSKLFESWQALCQGFLATPTAALASAPALSDLDLLREPLSVAPRVGAFSCSEMKLGCVEHETSQATYVGEGNSSP